MRLAKTIGSVIIGLIIIHLLISYAIWDINPSNWTNATRGAAAFSYFILIYIIASIYIIKPKK